MIITSVHVQGTLRLALLVTKFTIKNFALVLVYVSDVDIQSIFSGILPSTVGATEIFNTYNKYS